jgi:hypothetical protein
MSSAALEVPMRSPFGIRPLAVLAGLSTVAAMLTSLFLAAQDSQAGSERSQDQELTAEERDLAGRLAREAIQQRALVTTGPLYVSRVELLRDKVEEAKPQPARLALVTQYRYQGDLTIHVSVDLTHKLVVNVDTASGVSAPLAQEEFEKARQLALADSRVQAALKDAARRVIVEPLVVRSSDPADSLAGHRVVRLLFRLGQDYLSEPIVLVDLTRSTVLLERSRR